MPKSNAQFMNTIVQEKIVILEKKKQVPYIQTSAKKVMMKNLLIADLKLEAVLEFDNERFYSFYTSLVDTKFLIKENIVSKEMVLFQEKSILDTNAGVCELLINKLVA